MLIKLKVDEMYTYKDKFIYSILLEFEFVQICMKHNIACNFHIC
jgi:hypothetical protein